MTARISRSLSDLAALARLWQVVFLHKCVILVSGRRARVPLGRLVLHDLSKLGPSESIHYARHRYGRVTDASAFPRAMALHFSRNEHHWEFWVRDGIAAPMSEAAVREMVADWMAATRKSIGRWPDPDGDWEWMEENVSTFVMHPLTWARLRAVIAEVYGRDFEWIAPASEAETKEAA